MSTYGEGVAGKRKLYLSLEGRHGEPTIWVQFTIPNDILLTMPLNDVAERYFKPAFMALKMKISEKAAS